MKAKNASGDDPIPFRTDRSTQDAEQAALKGEEQGRVDKATNPVIHQIAYKMLPNLSEGERKTIAWRRLSVEEMAQRIATMLEAISRSLNVLKSLGAIWVSRTEIAALSKKQLTDLAQVVSLQEAPSASFGDAS